MTTAMTPLAWNCSANLKTPKATMKLSRISTKMSSAQQKMRWTKKPEMYPRSTPPSTFTAVICRTSRPVTAPDSMIRRSML